MEDKQPQHHNKRIFKIILNTILLLLILFGIMMLNGVWWWLNEGPKTAKIEQNKKIFHFVMTETDPNFNFLKQDIKEGVIFKGLSRKSDEKNFSEESKKPHFQKHTDYFYKESKKIELEFIKRIKDILKTKNAIRIYPKNDGELKTIKFCGGFHADYMVTLKTETQKIDIQICYGCSDIRLFLDNVFIDEYGFNTEYAFKEWTDPYSDLGSSTE